MPEKTVAEGVDALGGFEFFPGGGVDVLVDALDVEEAFGGDEFVGVEAEIVDVVVPAGMFAEGGEEGLGAAFWRSEEAREVFEEGCQVGVSGVRVQGSATR